MDCGLGPDAKTSFNRYKKRLNFSAKGPRASSSFKINNKET